MDDKTVQNQIETEQKIIHLMLKSRSAIDEILDSGIAPEMLDPDHKILVQSIYNEYISSDRKRLLNRETYSRLILDRGDKANLLHRLKIYDICFVGVFADQDDLGHIKREFFENYFASNVRNYLKAFNDETKNKGYQFATQQLVDRLQGVLGVSETREVLCSNVADLKNAYLSIIKNKRANPGVTIRCGIPEIDDVINVGFEPQHLTLFVGDTGSFKTALMMNITLNLAERGHPVLFIPLEMPWKDLLNRIICNRVGISSFRLAKPEMLSDDEMKQMENAEIWNNNISRNFHILESRGGLSIASLKREVERRVMIFKPKVLVIDYADILDVDVRYQSRTIEIGEMIKSIRELGKRYEFHIISAAQMNRAAIKSLREGKEEAVDSTAIHGSHSYSTHSDTIFGLIKVPGESNRLKISTIKARHGPSGQTQELNVDPTRFLISSCVDQLGSLLQPNLETAINRQPSEILEHIQSPNVDFVSSDLDIESLGT